MPLNHEINFTMLFKEDTTLFYPGDNPSVLLLMISDKAGILNCLLILSDMYL